MAIFIGKTSININGNKWSIFHSYLSFVTDMEQQERPAAQWQGAFPAPPMASRVVHRTSYSSGRPRDLTTIGDSWDQAKKTNGFIADWWYTYPSEKYESQLV